MAGGVCAARSQSSKTTDTGQPTHAGPFPGLATGRIVYFDAKPAYLARLAELIDQNWNRNKSAKLAMLEGISLTDQHWDVIDYLRKLYLKHGLPRYARTTARALNRQFAAQGGRKYLYRLFAAGPVTQGSRLANLRTPANATDASFGTSY